MSEKEQIIAYLRNEAWGHEDDLDPKWADEVIFGLVTAIENGRHLAQGMETGTAETASQAPGEA